MSDAWSVVVSIPEREKFPPHEQPRVEHCEAREMVLDDDWDDIALAWRTQYLDPTVEVTFGPPDTSRNALQHGARQLTTPGLYGVEPSVVHTDPAAKDLVDMLSEMGWSTKLQEVQFKTVGMGDYAVTVEVTERGTLQLCPVSPADHWVAVHPDQPDVPHTVWRLRLRWFEDVSIPVRSGYRWTWDVLSVYRDPFTGRLEPCYRVLRRNPHWQPSGTDEPPWLDESARFLGEDRPPEGYVGESYPWRDQEGEPFLPWVWYRAHDTGRTWNHHVMRGLHRGTLMTSLHWSYASKAALGASGRAVLTVGVAEPAAQIKESQQDGTPTRTMAILPGTMLFGAKDPDYDGQPLVTEFGPGADLASLQDFATFYETGQMARWGISPSDVQRVSDTPASGVSLYISAKGRREYQARIEPLFRKADPRLLFIVANLMRLTGMGNPPVGGYSIVYPPIPASPQERKEGREHDDWRLEHGHVSEVQLYMERHPGLTEAQAMEKLVEVKLQETELQRLTKERMEVLGILDAAMTDSTTEDSQEDEEGEEMTENPDQEPENA